MTDYDFLNEPGISRISSISASQALRASSTQHPSALPLPTGLDGLDDAICTTSIGLKRPDPSAANARSSSGGIPRGSITEIYGPPGVGKTTISLNIAAKALTSGLNEKVIWIDTGSPIPRPRLKDLLISNLKNFSTKGGNEPIDDKLNDCMNRFCYLRAPSLPHLLSLFSQSPSGFPAEGTALLIVDSISAPFQPYFPNATELRSRLGHGPGQAGQSRSPEHHQTQWLLNRKWNVTSDMANKMMKLATSRHIAIVLLNQTHTKIKGQPRPTLYPALAGGSWETCIHTRIVLYRDWAPSPSTSIAADQKENRKLMSKVRYAEIMKKAGKVISVRTDVNIFPFLIEDNGIRELYSPISGTTSTQQQQINSLTTLQSSPPPLSQSSLPQSVSTMTVRKRKVDEVADSEDENDDDDNDDDVLLLNGEVSQLQWDKNEAPANGENDQGSIRDNNDKDKEEDTI